MYDLLSADIGEKKYGNVIAEVAFIPSGFVEYAYIPPSPFDGRRLPTERAIERALAQPLLSLCLSLDEFSTNKLFSNLSKRMDFQYIST
jgi:hypothetical protein